MVTPSQLDRCKAIRAGPVEQRAKLMADVQIDEATYAAALEELKIAETAHGGVIMPADWPRSGGTEGVWQWLLGPKFPPNDPWNGATLLAKAKMAVQVGMLHRSDVRVHEPFQCYEPFWGYDINRNRLPVVIPNLTPGSISPGMPSNKNRKLLRHLEALRWLYGSDDYNITHYVAIQAHAPDLHRIILKLGTLIALRNMLTALTNGPRAKAVALWDVAKSASLKREHPREDDDDAGEFASTTPKRRL